VRRALLLAVLLATPGSAAAQASIFGVRGLGIPQGPVSARAIGMGGSFSLLDGLSGTNPAAITSVVGLTAGLNWFQDWRSSTTPAGTGSASDAGFPYAFVVNRVKESKVFVSGSFGSYTDRDFGVVTVDSTPVNGVPVTYRDSLASKGGVSDFRLAVGYRMDQKLSFGFGFHFITGSDRLSLQRTFGDTAFAPVVQRSELAYNAIGMSLGAVYHPVERLLLAAVIRHDGEMNVDRDSSAAFKLTLPWSFAGGAQYRASTRANVNAQVEYSAWSSMNDQLQSVGGVGSDNTLRASFGVELATNQPNPAKFPLRLGVRTAQLPFPLQAGVRPREFAISTGTGLRFGKSHAAADFALQRIWRSEDSGFTEKAWLFSMGVTLKP
jgi:hypothetical protein